MEKQNPYIITVVDHEDNLTCRTFVYKTDNIENIGERLKTVLYENEGYSTDEVEKLEKFGDYFYWIEEPLNTIHDI